jgi:hypothetical protein
MQSKTEFQLQEKKKFKHKTIHHFPPHVSHPMSLPKSNALHTAAKTSGKAGPVAGISWM